MQETGRRFVDGHPEIYVVSNVVAGRRADRQPGIGRGRVAHRHVVPCRPAEGERALCARSAAAAAATPASARCMRAWDAAARPAAAPRRRAAGQARRHLQQRRLRPPGRDADRRSAHVARHASPAGVPSIRKPAGAASISGGGATPTSKGLSLDESSALLDEIWAEATRDSLTWRHQWRAGDLVLWDNRCTMHRRDASIRRRAGSCTARRFAGTIRHAWATGGRPQPKEPSRRQSARPEGVRQTVPDSIRRCRARYDSHADVQFRTPAATAS